VGQGTEYEVPTHVRYRDPAQPEKHEYYRAIYLVQQSLKDSSSGAAPESNSEPTKVIQRAQVLKNGLQVRS
jgi:hypothetical protein